MRCVWQSSPGGPQPHQKDVQFQGMFLKLLSQEALGSQSDLSGSL
jgi:hypothetical protein